MIAPSTVSEDVVFASHAFFRDYRVVLDAKRWQMVLSSHGFKFSYILVILNNFIDDKQHAHAYAMAETLLEKGLATHIIDARKFLTEERLQRYGLDKTFWANNPWFSAAQFSALAWAQEKKAAYLLHMAGDVWLQNPVAWIPNAIHWLLTEDQTPLIGFNLCRNIYVKEYPIRLHRELPHFWISDKMSDKPLQEHRTGRGWGLSDHAFFLKIDEAPSWNFAMSAEEILNYEKLWPLYARPCFEMYVTLWMIRHALSYGALKYIPELTPLTKHKSYPKKPLKTLYYKLLGRYHSNGKYATQYIK